MFNLLLIFWQNRYRRPYMDKILRTIDLTISWMLLICFVLMAVLSLFYNIQNTGIYIAGALGWSSYLYVRSKYDTLKDMIQGNPKDVA